jgi:exopolysaccharide production protein ExoQ
MIVHILAILLVILPVIVLFSGIAMAPLLVIMALLVLLTIPAVLRNHPEQLYPPYKNLLKGLALLLVLPLIGSAWSITPAFTLETAVRVTLLCALGCAAFIYIPGIARARASFITSYTISIMVVSFLVLQELLLGGGLIKYAYHHLGIPYDRLMAKNINRGLCALSVFIWPLMLAYYEKNNARRGWLVFALLACAIMLMHSLSAKVGLVAGVISFFAFRRYPLTLPRAISLVFPLALVCVPLLYVLLEHTVMMGSFVQGHLTESGVHRLHIWHVLLEQVQQKPWLGWGIDTTRAMPLTQEQLAAINLPEPPLHPHNPSIQILMEQGIVGLLASAAGLGLLLREWVRMPLTNANHRATTGALIVSYVAAGISSFGMWQHWWIATLFIAGMLWRYVAHSTTLTQTE